MYNLVNRNLLDHWGILESKWKALCLAITCGNLNAWKIKLQLSFFHSFSAVKKLQQAQKTRKSFTPIMRAAALSSSAWLSSAQEEQGTKTGYRSLILKYYTKTLLFTPDTFCVWWDLIAAFCAPSLPEVQHLTIVQLICIFRIKMWS